MRVGCDLRGRQKMRWVRWHRRTETTICKEWLTQDELVTYYGP